MTAIPVPRCSATRCSARPPGRVAGALRRRGGLAARALVWFWVTGSAALPSATLAQWVEPPGRGWVDVSVFHLDTRDAFHADGAVRAFDPFTQAHAVSTSAFVTVALGLLPGVDAWLQVPVQRLRFDDLGADRLRTGVGDTRAYLRVQPGHHFGSGVPVAIRAGAKIPVGDFAVDAEIIPLGDGQRDWELVLELGRSLHPVPAYVSAWIGHRWREENRRSRRDFGDEVFFLLSGGMEFGRLGASLIVEGWDGGVPVIEDLPIPTASRSMLRLTPSLSHALGAGSAKAGVQVPLRGTNLPAGNTLVIGYFVRFGSRT